MNINIRDIDSMTIKLLDDIVGKEKYLSRNQLLVEILNLYVTSHHEFFTQALPPTVNFLCQEAITKQEKMFETMFNITYNLNANVLKKLDTLSAIFETGSDISND